MPTNPAAAAVGRPLPPIADSRSHTSLAVTAPIRLNSSHIPARMSPACREGIISPDRTREYARVITSTGRMLNWLWPNGIR